MTTIAISPDAESRLQMLESLIRQQQQVEITEQDHPHDSNFKMEETESV